MDVSGNYYSQHSTHSASSSHTYEFHSEGCEFLFSADFFFSKYSCAKISADSFIFYFSLYFAFLPQFHIVFPHFCQKTSFVKCPLRRIKGRHSYFPASTVYFLTR